MRAALDQHGTVLLLAWCSVALAAWLSSAIAVHLMSASAMLLRAKDTFESRFRTVGSGALRRSARHDHF
jgi:hypothetical protein